MKRNSVSLFLSLFNPKAFFLFTKLHFILESSMHYDCSLILHDKGCVTKQAEFILCLDVNLICVPKFSSLEWRTVEVKVLCELLRTETSQRNKHQNMQITCWSVLGQNKRANWNKSLSLPWLYPEEKNRKTTRGLGDFPQDTEFQKLYFHCVWN